MPLTELTDGERALLRVLTDAPEAWTELDALAGSAAEVAALAAAGYLERWTLPGDAGPTLVTLTPWGAWAARVELVEVGPRETPRWADSPAEPRPVRIPRHARECPLPFPELVVDPHPGPAELAEGPDLVRDEWSGEPVRLFGLELARDPRLKPSPPRRAG